MSNRTLGLMMGAVALLIVAVAVVFVLVLAGGDGGDDGSTDPTPASARDTSSGDDGGDASSADESDRDDGDRTVAGVCSENRLIIPGSSPATVFDPIQVSDASTAEYTAEIFGGLVSLDLDLNVVPDIAESWEISDGGRVYTFFLRDDVVFHNGRRVTADDVKYSLDRAADPANSLPPSLATRRHRWCARQVQRPSRTRSAASRSWANTPIRIGLSGPSAISSSSSPTPLPTWSIRSRSSGIPTAGRVTPTAPAHSG